MFITQLCKLMPNPLSYCKLDSQIVFLYKCVFTIYMQFQTLIKRMCFFWNEAKQLQAARYFGRRYPYDYKWLCIHNIWYVPLPHTVYTTYSFSIGFHLVYLVQIQSRLVYLVKYILTCPRQTDLKKTPTSKQSYSQLYIHSNYTTTQRL